MLRLIEFSLFKSAPALNFNYHHFFLSTFFHFFLIFGSTIDSEWAKHMRKFGCTYHVPHNHLCGSEPTFIETLYSYTLLVVARRTHTLTDDGNEIGWNEWIGQPNHTWMYLHFVQTREWTHVYICGQTGGHVTMCTIHEKWLFIIFALSLDAHRFVMVAGCHTHTHTDTRRYLFVSCCRNNSRFSTHTCADHREMCTRATRAYVGTFSYLVYGSLCLFFQFSIGLLDETHNCNFSSSLHLRLRPSCWCDSLLFSTSRVHLKRLIITYLMYEFL